MHTKETCLCTKRVLDFRSEFDGDVVTKIYCPECVDRAPGDAIIFELCEPGEYSGVWAVLYNKGELKRLDEHYRDSNDYYLSLLISGVCGPSIARDYTKGGLCRIFGFKGSAQPHAQAEIDEALGETVALVVPRTKKKPAAKNPKKPVEKKKKAKKK